MLILCLLFTPSFFQQTKAQQVHSIENRGQTWTDSMIQVCIVPQENQSWWKPQYLDAAVHGVAMWNDAVQEFSLNHPEFGYLSGLSLVPTVAPEPEPGFDVYVGWIAECELEETIGQTRLLVNGSCSIINSTVCLAAKAPSGHVMTQTDMQNIVVHELGHNLGLSHCSYSEDAMYAVVQYRETVKPLSTLDLFAVSQNFEWMRNSTQFNQFNSCPEQTTLSLPENISYSYFPIAKENMPALEPKGFTEQLSELFFSPEILVGLLAGAVLVFVVVLIVTRFRKKKLWPL